MRVSVTEARSPRRLLGSTLVILATLLAISCHDPAGRTDDGPWLEGRLTDAAGAPVAAAPVSIVYGFVGHTRKEVCYPWVREPVIAALTRVDFDLEHPAIIDLVVLDFRRRTIRTLVHGELPAGRHSAIWNGTDDSGRRVPAGAYYYRLRIHEPTRDQEYERKLFVMYCSNEECAAAPHAVTDADG